MSQPINLDKKKQPTLADLFPKRELKAYPVQPIFLSGVKIPGLSQEQSHNLGMNYFCVIGNSGYDSFSKLYKYNRENGKPSFITVDSLLHPYFAFKNALLGHVIEESIYDDLGHLLRAVIAASIQDYANSEDAEVKDDIRRNLAYLSVGLKLLEPDCQLPKIGNAKDLVDKDYASCLAGVKGRSYIFNQDTDFSYCLPWGWYKQSEKIKRFYRSYQWLSRVYFPLKNVAFDKHSGGDNKFRRAVLLYRALSLGRVYGKPALAYWSKVGNIFALCGMDNYYRIHTILPPDLSSVLSKSRGDFDKLLDEVSKPYARTKLMLNIRKQRPVNLGATSIFEIGGNIKKEDDLEVVRFFPLVQPAELNWLKHVAHEFKSEAEAPTPTPLSLLTMHAHGSVCATNLLSMQLETLDKRLLTAIPRLERIISISKGGRNLAETDTRWRILSMLFRPYSDSVQIALRTNLWYSRQIETAMGAWIDSYTAYLPVEGKSAKSENLKSKAPTKTARHIVKRANFHYLEPRPIVYDLISNDLANLQSTLNEQGAFPEKYSKRLNDFRRLYGRLTNIATREIDGKPIFKEDFSLLANVDRLLNPVDSPAANAVYFNLGKPVKSKEEGKGEGATIGIGDAGRLYIVCSTTQGTTLCRGGVYTLYETSGGPYPRRHWLRKVKYGMLLPPVWARPFDYFQKSTEPKISKLK